MQMKLVQGLNMKTFKLKDSNMLNVKNIRKINKQHYPLLQRQKM